MEVAVEWLENWSTEILDKKENASASDMEVTLEWLKKLSPRRFKSLNLPYLKRIKKLDLSRTAITDKDLKHISPLTTLTRLDLGNTNITDQGLKELGSLTSLTRLNLSNTNITDQGLKELGSFAFLARLDLGHTNITDQGLKELGSLVSLITLDLGNTQITGQGLKELSSSAYLGSLDLGNTKITDKVFKELSSITYLSSLDLSNTQITGQGLKDLGSITSLTSLNLSNTQITDQGLKELSCLTSLTKLDLDYIKQKKYEMIKNAGIPCSNSVGPDDEMAESRFIVAEGVISYHPLKAQPGVVENEKKLDQVELQSSDTIKILFIGNLYTSDNDLPSIFLSLASTNGKTVIVKAFTRGGYRFKHHKNSTVTLNAIKSESWDFIVLQDQSQFPGFRPKHVASRSLPNAIDLANTIHTRNVDTQIVYFVTWGRKNEDDLNCDYYPKVCDFRGHTEALSQGYSTYQSSTGGVLAEVGQRWLSVINDPNASASLKDLWTSDNSHPTYKGSYLAANTIYTAIFNEGTTGIEFYGSLNKSEAIYYQQIASRN